ncbi:MAG: DUF4105 domain-containing protein, partial [Proteobacteria bacterium]|nr:DUF4105 domain-containing protein [Pseudomonadota bacterium]
VPLSSETFSDLTNRFGIELNGDETSESWTEIEGNSIVDLMESLPESLSLMVKNHALPNFVVKKVYRLLAFDPDDLAGRYDSGRVRISVYRHGDMQVEDTEYSSRQREIVAFILSRNLIAANMDNLDQSSDPARIRQRLTHYLSYLKRELVTHLFYAYDTVYKKSATEEWLSFSRWRHQSVLGWEIRGWFRDAENQHLNGYAHPSALLGPRQDFAVTAASFFVTPVSQYRQSIKCMIPNKYAYFKRLFPEYDPHLDRAEFVHRKIRCPKIDDDFAGGLEFKNIYTGEKIPIGPINADSVSGFELIYATPGDREISEIAGHLLLRIKLDNNPEAKALGIENPYDIVVAILADNNEHWRRDGSPKPVVTESHREICPPKKAEEELGFSEIYKGSIQALKGLSGLFRTIFQVDTLQYAIDHYTVKNNRTLERYRLNLTEAQKVRLLEHFYLAMKNFKTDYHFFTRNCGSILAKLVGEAYEDAEVADYNILAAPPNSLLTLLLEKNLISPLYPHFYSYTARAQIAEDLIVDSLEKLRCSHPDEPWPDDASFFNTDSKTRSSAYAQLYPIAVKNAETRIDILYILKTAQEAELQFTWNKGRCIGYSTETKGEARKILKRLSGIVSDVPAIDLDREIDSRDSGLEEIDNRTGSRHTRLMSWKVGIGRTEIPGHDPRDSFILGGAIYRQNMGDISNRAMQRGTSVEMGNIEFAFGADEKGQTDIAAWRIIGLQIRKIKARRHYIPDVFSRNRKMGLGFTVLDICTDPFEEKKYSTTFVEGEIFTSLISSRLNLDHLNVSIGMGLETPWEHSDHFGAKFLSDGSRLGIPLKLDGLLTFGADRDLQIRALLEYKHTFDIEVDYSMDWRNGAFSARTSFLYHLSEIGGAEVLLLGEFEFQDTFRRNSAGNPIQRRLGKLGLEINRW